MCNRILAPIDGSETSAHAFDTALKLARENGAELQPLYVVDTSPISVFYPEIRDVFLREGAHLSADSIDRMRREGVKGAPRVVEVDLTGDDIAHCILRSAAEFDADLVVMGTHGRRGWRRLMLGSIAERFLRVATCPVLLIPGRNAEECAANSAAASEPLKDPS